MHEVAGQPIRRADHHEIKRCPRRLVAQRVQTRTVQPGAAAAVVAKDVLGGDGPPDGTSTRSRVNVEGLAFDHPGYGMYGGPFELKG